jgi:hypothetical protein
MQSQVSKPDASPQPFSERIAQLEDAIGLNTRRLRTTQIETMAADMADELLACIREQQSALDKFMAVTEGGVEGGIFDMMNLHSRCRFYERVDAARSKTSATLAKWEIEP